MSTAYEIALSALSPELMVLNHDAELVGDTNTLTDQFTDTNGTLLSAHTADSGDTWTQNGSSTATASITSNRVYSTTAADAIYYSSDVPAAADYVVEGKLRCISNTATYAGVLGRCTTTSPFSAYRLYYFGVFNTWSLSKIVSGTNTVLDTWSETLAVGDERTIKLKVDGSCISGTIDGTVQLEAEDTAVTATGRPGVHVNGATSSAGFHLDYIKCRPFKTAFLTDSTGHGHFGIAVGEFTLGERSFGPGEGGFATVLPPQKGGYARFPGYTPFTPSSSRTFTGSARIDQTTDIGVQTFLGGEGNTGAATLHHPVLEASFNSNPPAGYSSIVYNSEIAVQGVFGAAAWGGAIPLLEWFHWALTVVDNGTTQTARFFCNGENLGAADFNPTPVAWSASSGNYLLGQRGQGNGVPATGHGLNGAHGAQAVFNRVLTDNEILGLYEAAQTIDPASENLPLALHGAGRGQ